MKNLEKQSRRAGQSDECRTKSHKHDANLQKNSSLYFQVGLILCLLLTYGLFEMKFEDKEYNLATVSHEDTDVEYAPELFQVEEQIVKEKVETSKNTVVLTKDPIIKKDDDVEPTLEILTDPEPDVIPVDPDQIVVVEDPGKDVEPEIFSIIGVEQVPIYPGCESATNNDERRACMSEKLSGLIKRQFDTNIASELGLKGIQKIYVQFKIDKSGHVTEILSRAPSERLETEAERVLNKVPQMIPGKQRHRPVTVLYTLPILFDVQ